MIGFDEGENFFLFRQRGVESKTRTCMEVSEARIGTSIVVVRASSGRPASSIFPDFPPSRMEGFNRAEVGKETPL